MLHRIAPAAPLRSYTCITPAALLALVRHFLAQDVRNDAVEIVVCSRVGLQSVLDVSLLAIWRFPRVLDAIETAAASKLVRANFDLLSPSRRL